MLPSNNALRLTTPRVSSDLLLITHEGYIVTDPPGHAITTPASLDALRRLADEFYELE